MISSSGSDEANCIQGKGAVIADPHLSLSLNWAGHLTTLEPGGRERRSQCGFNNT